MQNTRSRVHWKNFKDPIPTRKPGLSSTRVEREKYLYFPNPLIGRPGIMLFRQAVQIFVYDIKNAGIKNAVSEICPRETNRLHSFVQYKICYLQVCII